MSDYEIKHLEKAGERFALLLQVASVSRGFIHDEEIESIQYFIDALQARYFAITNKD